MSELSPIVARKIIEIMDLTVLDLFLDVTDLINRAHSPYGNVAAVCIYPDHVEMVRAELDRRHSSVKLATVANFPEGELNRYRAIREVKKAIEAGADEVDVVFPYRALLQNQGRLCLDFLMAIRQEIPETAVFKVIIETGRLETEDKIKEATRLAAKAGADFVKTSTGRKKPGASLKAARWMMETLLAGDYEHQTGIKISGGVREYRDAVQYLDLAIEMMGIDWVTPEHFRIGSSQLYDNLIEIIEAAERS